MCAASLQNSYYNAVAGIFCERKCLFFLFSIGPERKLCMNIYMCIGFSFVGDSQNVYLTQEISVRTWV